MPIKMPISTITGNSASDPMDSAGTSKAGLWPYTRRLITVPTTEATITGTILLMA